MKWRVVIDEQRSAGNSWNELNYALERQLPKPAFIHSSIKQIDSFIAAVPLGGRPLHSINTTSTAPFHFQWNCRSPAGWLIPFTFHCFISIHLIEFVCWRQLLFAERHGRPRLITAQAHPPVNQTQSSWISMWAGPFFLSFLHSAAINQCFWLNCFAELKRKRRKGNQPGLTALIPSFSCSNKNDFYLNCWKRMARSPTALQ